VLGKRGDTAFVQPHLDVTVPGTLDVDHRRGETASQGQAPKYRGLTQRSNERLILKPGTLPTHSQSESINIYEGLPLLGADGPLVVWPDHSVC